MTSNCTENLTNVCSIPAPTNLNLYGEHIKADEILLLFTLIHFSIIGMSRSAMSRQLTSTESLALRLLRQRRTTIRG